MNNTRNCGHVLMLAMQIFRALRHLRTSMAYIHVFKHSLLSYVGNIEIPLFVCMQFEIVKMGRSFSSSHVLKSCFFDRSFRSLSPPIAVYSSLRK